MALKTNGARTGAIAAGRGEVLGHVRYEDLLRVVGGYIDQHGFTDVIITQIPDGVLLKGTVVEHGSSGPVERINAVLFTDEDIVALLQQSARRRGSTGRQRPHFD